MNLFKAQLDREHSAWLTISNYTSILADIDQMKKSPGKEVNLSSKQFIINKSMLEGDHHEKKESII